MKIATFLLLLGVLFTVANGFKTPTRLFLSKHLDKDTARAHNAKYEERITEAWNKNTNLNHDSPSSTFYHEKLGSKITGKIMYSFRQNRTIYAYQGFRFGNGTRFQPAKLEGNYWGRHFKAIHIGFKCPQFSYIGSDPAGNEDCLFLNVYTPYNPETSNQSLPVMFYIHGGEYIEGDASLYLPTKLLDHDVILVTIHYRLGAFGFFTLNNEDAPGNIALYDMVTALNWVNMHIAGFKGDPDRVTVFGQSAGSASVNYMMLAETVREKGFFRAIMAESGSCLDYWAVDADPSYAAQYIANYTGCVYENATINFQCLLEVPFQELVDAEDNLIESDRQAGYLGFRGAAPTIQTFELSQDAEFELIITKRPVQYFMDDDFEKVHFLTGSNKNEGSYILGITYLEYLQPNNLTNNVTYLREQMIQDILESVGMSDDTHSIATSLQNYYCPDLDMGNFTAATPCLNDLLGTILLKAGSWQVANYHSYFAKNFSTYYYSFEFESDDSLFPWIFGNSLPFDGGVAHMDETLYIFDLPAVMDYPGQMDTVDRMTTMWTNFATYLDPTPKDQQNELSQLGIPIWIPYQFENHSVLIIADTLWLDKEFSKRWTIGLDEVRATTPEEGGGGGGETCDGLCKKYKDQEQTFKNTMIAFVVLTFVGLLIAGYFIFKARR